ncbi:MAG: hypothetical protein ASARMPRED_005786 [Alectoria sarmentosa]|nr:MAG: hypothetical protein ASARMPRED_005786 [Alectoria sarmentosa]
MSLAILIGTSLFASLVSAAIFLPPSQQPNNTLLALQTLSPPLLPSNITAATTPPSNVLRIQCDGTHYGRNLSPNSCRGVFGYIAKSDDQTTFSERHTGRPNDLPLPWRILSNDGLCFVQPLLLRGAVTGHVSSTQIGQAAYALYQRCVVERGVGGIAADVGGDNHLNIVIADYAPRASVEITGKSTSAEWYEIWEAMSALSVMCVRARGKGGKAFGLGLRKNIFIQISDENPDPSQFAANAANVSTSVPSLGLEAFNASSEVNESGRLSETSFEASIGAVQGSNTILVVPDNATSGDLEDSLA